MEKRKYRICEEPQMDGGGYSFSVQVKGLLMWHVIKTFTSLDREYAKMLAEELLDMLECDY